MLMKGLTTPLPQRSSRTVAPQRALPSVRPLRSIGLVAVSRGSEAPEGAPKVPKRAPSAYNFYVKTNYATVKANLTSQGKPATLGECSGILKDEWDILSDAARASYVRQAEQAKQDLAAVRAEMKDVETEKKSKRATTPNALQATRAPSAWVVFLKASFPAMKAKHPEAKMTDITKLVSANWKTLSDNEKAKYKSASPPPPQVLSKVQEQPPARSSSPTARATPASAAAPAKAATPARSQSTPDRPATPAGRQSPAPPAGKQSPPPNAGKQSPPPAAAKVDTHPRSGTPANRFKGMRPN